MQLLLLLDTAALHVEDAPLFLVLLEHGSHVFTCRTDLLAAPLHNPWILCPEHHSIHCTVFAHLCMWDQFLPFLVLASFCTWVGTIPAPFITRRGFVGLPALLCGSRYLFYATVKVIHEQGWNMILIFIQAELKITAIDLLLSLSEGKGWGGAAGMSYGSCFLDWNGIPESEVLCVSTVLMLLQSHVLNLYWSFWSSCSSETYFTMQKSDQVLGIM